MFISITLWLIDSQLESVNFHKMMNVVCCRMPNIFMCTDMSACEMHFCGGAFLAAWGACEVPQQAMGELEREHPKAVHISRIGNSQQGVDNVQQARANVNSVR